MLSGMPSPSESNTALIVTDKMEAALEQELALATTLIVPPVAPEITVIELVVEVPVQSPGNVQV